MADITKKKRASTGGATPSAKKSKSTGGSKNSAKNPKKSKVKADDAKKSKKRKSHRKKRVMIANEQGLKRRRKRKRAKGVPPRQNL